MDNQELSENIKETIEGERQAARRLSRKPRTVDDYTARARQRGAQLQRTPDQILQDNALTAQLIHEGLYPAEIYQIVILDRYPLGQQISKKSFNNQIDKLRANWLENIQDNLDNAIAQKVAEIRNLKRAYWAGYRRSLGLDTDNKPITDVFTLKRGRRSQDTFESIYDLAEFEKAAIKGEIPKPKDRKKVKTRKDDEVGAKEWLDGVQWCLKYELEVRFGLKKFIADGAARRRRDYEMGDDMPPPPTEQGALPASGQEYQMPDESIAGNQVAAIYEEMRLVAEKRRQLAAGKPENAEPDAVDAVFEDVTED